MAACFLCPTPLHSFSPSPLPSPPSARPPRPSPARLTLLEASPAPPAVPAYRTVPFPGQDSGGGGGEAARRRARWPTVIIPGYGADARQYEGLREALGRATGGAVSVVPVRWGDWARTLGGRPVDGVLDLVEREVARVARAQGETTRVNIVGHSAGGWVARLWMGEEAYCGRVWGARGRVAALLSLGTPHRSAEPVTRRNMAFVNAAYPGCWLPGVRYVCVGGLACRVRPADAWRPWSRRWFAKISYQLTAGAAAVDGDGVIPVDVAGLPGAENVMIEGVWHSPASPGPWYGHEDVVRYWAQFLV